MRAIEPDNLCGDTMQLTPALRKKSYNVKEPPVREHRTVRQEMLSKQQNLRSKCTIIPCLRQREREVLFLCFSETILKSSHKSILISKQENIMGYRKDTIDRYKQYYNKHFFVDIDNDKFQVHHIDFDRSNNDFSNLLILPAALHRRYHTTLEEVDRCEVYVPYAICTNRVTSESFNYGLLCEYMEVYAECMKWMKRKEEADMAFERVVAL